MELQKIKDWVDLVLKGLSIVAILATGAWALYQFEITEVDAANVQLNIATEVVKYSEGNKLLMIHLHPRNIGKVLVKPQHLTVTIRNLPEGLKPRSVFVVDVAKLKQQHSEDIQNRYKDGYELEPGVEYDELVTMIVPKGIYTVTGEIDLGDKTIVDQTTVVRVD